MQCIIYLMNLATLNEPAHCKSVVNERACAWKAQVKDFLPLLNL